MESVPILMDGVSTGSGSDRVSVLANSISPSPGLGRYRSRYWHHRGTGRHGSGRSEARHATTTINEGREALLARGFTGIHRLWIGPCAYAHGTDGQVVAELEARVYLSTNTFTNPLPEMIHACHWN